MAKQKYIRLNTRAGIIWGNLVAQHTSLVSGGTVASTDAAKFRNMVREMIERPQGATIEELTEAYTEAGSEARNVSRAVKWCINDLIAKDELVAMTDLRGTYHAVLTASF